MPDCHDHPRYIELPQITKSGRLERAFIAFHNWLARRLDGMPEIRADLGGKENDDD